MGVIWVEGSCIIWYNKIHQLHDKSTFEDELLCVMFILSYRYTHVSRKMNFAQYFVILGCRPFVRYQSISRFSRSFLILCSILHKDTPLWAREILHNQCCFKSFVIGTLIHTKPFHFSAHYHKSKVK